MHRTNIYLSQEQEAALDAKARAIGSTRSEVLRQIIDRDLNLEDSEEVDALILELADHFGLRARQLSQDDPDLRIE